MLKARLAVLVCLLLLVGTGALVAQDEGRDQVNDVDTEVALGCGAPTQGNGSLYQGFTPAQEALAAVSLRLQYGNGFPAEGVGSTVNIRKGTVDGEVVATGSAKVPPPGATLTPVVAYDLNEPVTLTVGEAYVLEWVAPEAGDGVLMWMVGGDDPYEGGTAFDRDGAALGQQDFIFATHTEPPLEGIGLQRATMSDEVAAGEESMEAEQIPEAMEHFHAALAIGEEKGAGKLTGEDWFAAGLAHYYLLGEAFDEASKSGELGREDLEIAVAWRERVLNPASAAATGEIQVIGAGERVDISKYIVKGKTTIFDFFSEYCGPCVQVAPRLEALHKQRDDVVVVKVDINRPGHQGIDWKSPVAQQYGMNSIPHFKVFGPDGKLQAEGKAASGIVYGMLR